MIRKSLGAAAVPASATQPRWRNLGGVVAAARMVSNRPTPELARRHEIEEPERVGESVPARLAGALALRCAARRRADLVRGI